MATPRMFSGWFAVRRELTRRRQLVLTAISFLMPLALWCLVSYVPWIWHPDVRLTLSADRSDVTTVFTAGDHVSKGYFPTFVEAVREDNRAIREARESGEPLSGSKRANQKLLRHVAPLAIEEGWIEDGQGQDDEAIYALWRDLARGAKRSESLSEENLAIVRDNWERLGAASPVFDYGALPEEPLLKLVPQGVPANPSYLPAPDRVIEAAMRDFSVEVTATASRWESATAPRWG